MIDIEPVADRYLVRCNVTFLSIQEPGVSKVCPRCETESLSEALVGKGEDVVGSIFGVLLDAFDMCVYCGGKFRD